jgi:hypothetical protein
LATALSNASETGTARPRTAELVVPGVAAATGGALWPPLQAETAVIKRPARMLRPVMVLQSIRFSGKELLSLSSRDARRDAG